jgi:hypothetical protein
LTDLHLALETIRRALRMIPKSAVATKTQDEMSCAQRVSFFFALQIAMDAMPSATQSTICFPLSGTRLQSQRFDRRV